MANPSADQIVAAAVWLKTDRDYLLDLLGQVADAVLDQTPGGMSVAYLPADLLAEIRDRLT